MSTGFVTKGCTANCVSGNKTKGDLVYCCQSYKCNYSKMNKYSNIILFGQLIFALIKCFS